MSRRPRRVARRGPGLTGRLGSLLIIAGVLAAAWVGWAYQGPGPGAAPTSVILPKGVSVARIAQTLRGAGVIGSGKVFQLAARFTGAGRTLKAGEYEFPPGASMAQVLEMIRQGRVVRHLVSVPEGFTSDMVLDAVKAEPVLTGEAVAPPEGSVLPDSYQVQRGQDRAEARPTSSRPCGSGI